MRQITISGHHDAHHTVSAAVWIVAGIVTPKLSTRSKLS
jgi:hypothetical protein